MCFVQWLTLKFLQSSVRPRDTGGGGYVNRRGHVPQLSISDDNHHVTEAIGYMYEDNDGYEGRREAGHMRHPNNRRDGQPYTHSSLNDGHHSQRNQTAEQPARKPSNDGGHNRANGTVKPPNMRNNSWERQNGTASSPPAMRGRSPSDTATSSFPLNDIDYESSPAAVAQELSNLQALRRMSMDVAAAGDPDLPSMNAGPIVPAIAPSPSDSDDDTSRLFWVPARLHPELAPKEFKSFLESKADQIKRRSGEFTYNQDGLTSPTGSLSPSLSAGGSLRRKKSMLSRQIDNSNGRAADNYQDGAERLERKRSSTTRSQLKDPNLEELEKLVTDPTKMQRLSLESAAQQPGTGEGSTADDMPILPALAPGSSLRRSTRTTYRRGSQTKKPEGREGRMTFSKRMQEAEEKRKASAVAVAAVEPEAILRPSSAEPPEEPRPLTRVSTDPLGSSQKLNFSRPARGSSPTEVTMEEPSEQPQQQQEQVSKPNTPERRQWKSQISSHGRSTVTIPPEHQAIPQIIVQPSTSSQEVPTQSATTGTPPTSLAAQGRLPERTSSYQHPPTSQQATSEVPMPSKPTPGAPPLSARSPARPSMPARNKSPQTLDQMSQHPSPLPGTDTKTNDLSFIPTLTEDKKADNRKLKDRKEEPPRKSSWNWLLGKEEEKKKEEEATKKPKAKITKPPEKHDNARLDVLQSSIDGNASRGRESLVLDRDSLKLEEERKKESQRKSATGLGDTKKEKDGIFSSIFGGKKKGPDASGKKFAGRALSPEPPPRELKPDIDYNWTRFSILEERAIYRMAHIKLANPRRALYSQVLLSNFMYSYLAKVQQMHPQMNLPTNAKQQSQQQQQHAPSKQEQPEEFTQYQRYQEVGVFPISRFDDTDLYSSNKTNNNTREIGCLVNISNINTIHQIISIRTMANTATILCTITIMMGDDRGQEAASTVWKMVECTVVLVEGGTMDSMIMPQTLAPPYKGMTTRICGERLEQRYSLSLPTKNTDTISNGYFREVSYY